MLGTSTEDGEIGKGIEMARFQGKQYVVLRFIHKEKHVIFNQIEKFRRKIEICDGVWVVVSITV